MAYNEFPEHPDEFPEHPDESVASWMLTLFVAGIPVVGFIYMLVLAFNSDTTPSKRNFAYAMFIWQIIATLATIMTYVLFGAAIFAGR